MRRKPSFPFFLILLCLATHSYAQTGIIDPSRMINWTNPGILGGIPNRTTICATLNPGATSAQINSAIASCAANQVVYLNAGTYSLSGGINFSGKSNVTLRGAGPDQTILVFGTGASVGCETQQASMCIAGSSRAWVGNPGTVHNVTGGYTKGSTQITLDSVSGYQVGSLLIMDQLNDASDTGNVFVNDCGNIYLTGCTTSYGQEGNSPGRSGPPDRNQQQFFVITAISATTVAISSPVYMPNWRSSQSPQVWSPGVVGSNIGTMIGVEALTVDTTNDGSSATSNIEFGNCYQCWVKNIKSLNANRNHIWLYQTARTEVRDSYFYGTKNAASQSYGVESFMTSDDLVINNIFQHITCALMTGPSVGSVGAYNYMIDMYYSSVPTWQMWGLNGSHDTGTGMNLFEGNESNGFGMDLYHGPGALPTVFRNYYTGLEPGKTSNTEVAGIWAYNRFVNFVGNVLGTPGYHTVYEDSRGPQGVTGNSNHSIFLLGFSGVDESTSAGISYDLGAVTTLLRWGNFDYATNSTRWNAAEIPSGNPVPSSHTLPPSLFLTVKPGFWGTMPWPAIGPDVTGGYDTAGHVNKNPAHLCFDNTPRNADGTLNFAARNCY